MENRIEKRIYSINKLAYLLANGVDLFLTIEIDKITGHKKIYGTTKSDITDIIDKYYADENLHEFISMFNIIRDRLK